MPQRADWQQMSCRWRGLIVYCVFAALSGCATYHEQPITSEAIHEALQPPALNELSFLSSEIDHPLLAPLAINDRDGLSPDEAAIVAVLLNPALKAARDQAKVTEAQLLQARLLPNPELAASFETPIGGDTEGTVDAFGLGVLWDVRSLITHSAYKQAAEANQSTVRLDIAWQEWQIAMAAKAAVYALATLDEKTVLAEQQEQRLSTTLAQLRAAAANGRRTGADLAAIEKECHQASANLLELQAQQNQQRLQLNRILGLPPDTQLILQSGIDWSYPFDPPDTDTLLMNLELRRLDLVALRRGYESQEAAVRAAILNQFPKIDIGPILGRDTENVETAGIGLTVSLPVFDHNQGRVAVERATRKRLFDEYVNRVFQTRSDVELVRAQVVWLNRRVEEAEANRMELQARADQLRTALSDGRTDSLTYESAATSLVEAQMAILTLRGELAQAIVALELATGMYRIPLNEEQPTTSNLDEAVQ